MKKDLTDKYYADKEKQRKLQTDKRVKYTKECDNCKRFMSANKYEKNQGLCDVCLDPDR